MDETEKFRRELEEKLQELNEARMCGHDTDDHKELRQKIEKTLQALDGIDALETKADALDKSIAALKREKISLVWEAAKIIAENPQSERSQSIITELLRMPKERGFVDWDAEYAGGLIKKFCARPNVEERTRLIGNLFQQLVI